jgi:hypothetical protein
MSELYLLMMESVKGSLAVMSGVLVIAFLGLLVSLVLVVGVKTQQRLLLLPWQAGSCLISVAEQDSDNVCGTVSQCGSGPRP